MLKKVYYKNKLDMCYKHLITLRKRIYFTI